MDNLDKNIIGKQMIIFLHVPKTAGTTLRYIIQYQYKPIAVYELYNRRGRSTTHSQRLNELKKLPNAQKEKIRIISSHFGFGLHEFLPRPYTYITFLRKPVDRVISLYYYLHRTGGIPNITLEEFVQTYPEAQNGMTKHLSGLMLKVQLADPSAKAEINSQFSSETLEIAKRNLKDHFKVIGLSEKFDESLILLRKQLGWKVPLYDRSNVDNKQFSTRNVSKDTLSLIEKLNGSDIQVYECGKEIFEDLVNQQGASFDREVENFKQANESSKVKPFFKAHTFYNRVVHRTYKELARF